MKPFETLDQSTTPDGKTLALLRRDGGYYIFLDGEELMATRSPGSELALAQLGCEGLTATAPRVLIGGLGLGFTVKAALEALPPKAKVVVAELSEAVIRWNRTYFVELQGGALEDRRVEIRQGDVWKQILEGGPWDAVLLDVDNGPSAFCLDANGRLYGRKGLERIRQALVPGGRLAVWSAFSDPDFVRRLKKSGFDARARTVRARGTKGHRHAVFLALSRRRNQDLH